MFSSYFIFNNFKNGKVQAQLGHGFGQLTHIAFGHYDSPRSQNSRFNPDFVCTNGLDF